KHENPAAPRARGLVVTGAPVCAGRSRAPGDGWATVRGPRGDQLRGACRGEGGAQVHGLAPLQGPARGRADSHGAARTAPASLLAPGRCGGAISRSAGSDLADVPSSRAHDVISLNSRTLRCQLTESPRAWAVVRAPAHLCVSASPTQRECCQ